MGELPCYLRQPEMRELIHFDEQTDSILVDKPKRQKAEKKLGELHPRPQATQIS